MISSSSRRFDVEAAMDFLSALLILHYVVTAASPQVRAESDTLRLVHIVILDSIIAFISVSFSINLINY